YATKVEGLQSLLRATAEDALRHLVLFSSVTARMGNTGQADYAMANEVLNKTALQQASLRPDCKVIAINWGPWDGGMVTPSLRRNFLKQGISLIPLEAGARAMVDEMTQPPGQAVEVVIGGPLPQAPVQHPVESVKPSPAKALNLACKCDVSVEQYPVLHAHQLDGRPVVPLALITEWLAHSALHANPGLVLHGMDHLRLLSGIALDGQTRKIRMLAGKAHRADDLFEVDVEIRDGETENGHRIHSSAKAILSERLPAPPVFSENGHFQPDRPVGPIEEIYEQVLFHGRDLHGIQQIVRISNEGITARLATAPPPADWINDPLRSRWIADPLVLDSAFQMAIVWCHQQHGQVCLPSFAATYRQYCKRFTETGVQLDEGL
ncbi:MAG: polyketide synthase dehydratase domain-containing protein, partial [Desulfobacteraceae bacterium]